MKILLAVSDRDLLRSYTRLLEAEGHEVTPVFDGPQAMARMGREKYGLVIAEETLPGCTAEELIRRAEEKNIRSLLLTETRPGAGRLMQDPLPSAFLAFPFEPEDMRRTIRSIEEKQESGFCLAESGIRMTAAEMDMMRAAERGESLRGAEARTLILAVNEKLKAAGSRRKIIYEMKKGYRLVEGNE